MCNYLYKLFLITVLAFVLTSCMDQQDANRIEVSIPFLADCEKTIKKANKFLQKSTAEKKYQLGIEIDRFDVTPISHPELLGVARIYSVGDWKTLDGGSPRDYLLLQAESIKASCMPNNGIEVTQSDINNLFSLMQNIKSKGDIFLRADNNSLILYFNDGAYSYEE